MNAPTAGGRSTYLLLIAPPLFWSTMIVAGRAVIGEIPPASLTFWTWLAAVLGLLPFAAKDLRGQWPQIRRDMPRLLLLAALGVSAFQGLYYAGLERTTAVNAALLSPTLPVLVAVVAWMAGGERLKGLQVLGVIFALAGAVWISIGGRWQLLARLTLSAGDLFILAANLAMAFYTVLLRQRPPQLTPICFMTVIAILGTAILLPVYGLECLAMGAASVPLGHTMVILYIGIVTYDLGYIFWNISVARVGANMTALFLYLIPVFGTALAVGFLGEQVVGYHAAGIVLIFAGIYLSLHRAAPS